MNGSLTTLLCERYIVAKSKEMKTWCSPADPSKEGCGPRRAVFPMMIRFSKFRINT
jgi:hypothetical protein